MFPVNISKHKTYIQLYSEKCTGRYFKVRDDDLSSKHGYVNEKLLENILIYIFS